MSETSGKKWVTTMTRAVNNTVIPMALTQNNVIVYANNAFVGEHGDFIGKEAAALFDADSGELFRWLTKTNQRESDKTVLTLAAGKSAGGEALAQIWPLDDNFRLLSLPRDFSPHRIADLDELTRLPNRRKARLLLDVEQSYVSRSDGFCMAFCDIDRFKSINDTCGHQVGDDVLRHVADILRSGLRESDWVARWGGEEFLLFINGSDLATGMQPIVRIREMLNETPFAGPPAFPVTMSFGVVSSANGGDVETLINKADALMYQAKNDGRNRIICEEGGETVWHVGAIHGAIDAEKIVPHYAPVDDKTGRLVAVNIAHGLRGESPQDAERMLSAADRLRLRLDVDVALLGKTTAALPAETSAPFFFPVSNELIARRREALAALFIKHPYLCAGVSNRDALSAENQDALLAMKTPMALLDFSPAAAPMDLLAKRTLRHLVYVSPGREAAGVLTLLPSFVSCYVAGRDLSENAKFAGAMRGKMYDNLAAIGMAGN